LITLNDDRKKIWIDLDNTPHVPFFRPIIREIKKRGFPILLTARDCFQVCGLADLLGLPYTRIGHHYGKNKAMKMAGLLIRSFQLYTRVSLQRPVLAVSHGSRAQLLAARVMQIPSVVILDYEYVKLLVRPDWIIMPETIPKESVHLDQQHVVLYPGIKEDVYVPDFAPDPSIVTVLGLDEGKVIITIRPPATEAHYHTPESDKLFSAVLDILGNRQDIQMVLLPRNGNQADSIQKSWSALCSREKIIIPGAAIDGLNLMWHSDLVISGGGTMNREAAALGVPVYSIFRGKTGAVDRYLSEEGRLVLIEKANDISSKIRFEKRARMPFVHNSRSSALTAIVECIARIVGNE
jgi:predicted glycosyltransferase